MMFSSQQIIIDIGKYIWKKLAHPKEVLNLIFFITQRAYFKKINSMVILINQNFKNRN